MTMATSGLVSSRSLPKQSHGGNVRIELRGIFTRGPNKKLRRVYRSECRYDFSHVRFLVLSRNARLIGVALKKSILCDQFRGASRWLDCAESTRVRQEKLSPASHGNGITLRQNIPRNSNASKSRSQSTRVPQFLASESASPGADKHSTHWIRIFSFCRRQ